jgi:hypothetical protein
MITVLLFLFRAIVHFAVHTTLHSLFDSFEAALPV